MKLFAVKLEDRKEIFFCAVYAKTVDEVEEKMTEQYTSSVCKRIEEVGDFLSSRDNLLRKFGIRIFE